MTNVDRLRFEIDSVISCDDLQLLCGQSGRMSLPDLRPTSVIIFAHDATNASSEARGNPSAQVVTPLVKMLRIFAGHFNCDRVPDRMCESFICRSRWNNKGIHMNSLNLDIPHHKVEDLLRLVTPAHVWVERFKTDKSDHCNTIIERNLLLNGLLYFCVVDENSKISALRRVSHVFSTTQGYKLQLEGESTCQSWKELAGRYESGFSAISLSEPNYTSVSAKDNWSFHTSGGTPIPIRSTIPGDELTWAKNPQYLLEIETDEPRESELLVQLSQVDDNCCHEIFVCVCYAPPFSRPQMPIDRFAKALLVKEGGASYIRKSKSVGITSRVVIPNRFIIVPSTWETGVSASFQIDCNIRTCKSRTAVKLKRLNYLIFRYNSTTLTQLSS